MLRRRFAILFAALFCGCEQLFPPPVDERGPPIPGPLIDPLAMHASERELRREVLALRGRLEAVEYEIGRLRKQPRQWLSPLGPRRGPQGEPPPNMRPPTELPRVSNQRRSG